MQPTWNQARKMLDLASEARISLEQFQELVNKGLLADLLHCEHPGKVDREEFRRVIGYFQSVFPTLVGGDEIMEEIVSALLEDGVKVAEEFVRVFRHRTHLGNWTYKIEIIGPNHDFTVAEGLAILRANGLKRPTYEDVVFFMRQHAHKPTKKDNIAWLIDPVSDGDCNIVLWTQLRPEKILGFHPVLGGSFDASFAIAGIQPDPSILDKSPAKNVRRTFVPS